MSLIEDKVGSALIVSLLPTLLTAITYHVDHIQAPAPLRGAKK